MTRFQETFIRNLRSFRKEKGFSQLKFSEIINISPNYLNAVENGKNFPSPEVVQTIADALEILPYQLFLEYSIDATPIPQEKTAIIQELTLVKQKFIKSIDETIQKYKQS
jgi:transcriptional regulator with XRE-family HTH domain